MSQTFLNLGFWPDPLRTLPGWSHFSRPRAPPLGMAATDAAATRRWSAAGCRCRILASIHRSLPVAATSTAF